MPTKVTVNVHPEVEGFRVQEYPDSAAGPFVAVELGGGVALLVRDLDVMAGLVELVGRAQQQLAHLDANADRPTAGEPVGQTGLTLGSLPVGVE